MSQPEITKSLDVLTTYDTETGLVRYVVPLSQLDDVISTMNKQAERLQAENARLKSENNRLRRAGDGLMFEAETMAHEVSWNPAPWDRVVAAWVAAKEGRDAK